LPILKYDANQEALVEHTKGALVEDDGKTLMEEEGGTPMEEEEEPRTPSQSASEEGEDKNNTDKMLWLK
jgi:hypothetical protein